MKTQSQPVYISETPQRQNDSPVTGEYVLLDGQPFYRIAHYDAMAPFFMSIVSGSDHWLFLSSTGGLSAGRGNAEHALFPYYTEDKLTESSEHTGAKAILLVERNDRTYLWEPFSLRQQGCYRIERNLYKNVIGTALVFEEVNQDLQLTYRYSLRTGDRFGFIKTSSLINQGVDSCAIEFVDGLQNLVPANVTVGMQNDLSCLLDAYKRSEIAVPTSLGIFALNATLTDKAEPSESLLATTVAQIGLDNADYLLSTDQLDSFRRGKAIQPETQVRGRRCAYFVHANLTLPPRSDRRWYLIADVDQDSCEISSTLAWLGGNPSVLCQEVEVDIAANDQSLTNIVAASDGLQTSNNRLYCAYHFANALFNVMRGGIFADQYRIDTEDFQKFVAVRNPGALRQHTTFFAALPVKGTLSDLQRRAEETGSPDLIRLTLAYLPLIFSRRHGDPSRPWNHFSINIKQPDGSPRLDYQGNWRDIFQNWEALACSYPEFTENMISTFLSGTTADGYNPYRITRDGLDWETPDPGNPWANIGYWSDHQIIYLLKLLELSAAFHPGRLKDLLTKSVFSSADVPYRIKGYDAILADPYNTIVFDRERHQQIEARCQIAGTDGKLVRAVDGNVLHTSLTEKLLILLLAKLTNFVPEGGIWMNTQRPEWNDANNALVGKGISVVTLCYLRRYLAFCESLFQNSDQETFAVSEEVMHHFHAVTETLSRFLPLLPGSFTDQQRRSMMDGLGTAGSDYRGSFYRQGFSGLSRPLARTDILAFLEQTRQFVDHTLKANRREDGLYHAYNVLQTTEEAAEITRLPEMLEGQVAILSSGLLSAEESLTLLTSLRASALYRPDQQSYILYPDRPVVPFREKNRLTGEQIAAIPLLKRLADTGDRSLITRDGEGFYHFQSAIRNFADVQRTLDRLRQQAEYAGPVEADLPQLRELFEATFRHNEFTGRSGTFFAYEGLGSIYWHMVAKLLLAAQETALRFKDTPYASALLARYNDIRAGLSFAKSPAEYGAFPTDPYSHTPKDQGAKQPGMTGMVKEVILTRLAELGIFIENGVVRFDPFFVDSGEFLSDAAEFSYRDVHGNFKTIALNPGELACTLCQTPLIVRQAQTATLTVHYSDGKTGSFETLTLDKADSQHIFQRDGIITRLVVALS